MSKKVLSVGQCQMDHGMLTRYVKEQFAAQVVGVDSQSEMLDELSQSEFDLILVNRKLDMDHSDGVRLIARLKENPEFGKIPTMLVSNYPDAQEKAAVVGAEYGFGKSEFGSPETHSRLARFLS